MYIAFVVRLSLLTTVVAQLRLGVIETDQALVRICQAAIDRATVVGQCSQQIRLLNASGCGGGSNTIGTANAASLYFESQIQAIIGPNCNEELIGTGRLSYFWNIPVMARLACDPMIADTYYYPTVIQYAITSPAGLSHALKEFADYMNLTEVTLISPKPHDMDSYPIAEGVSSFLKSSRLLQVKKFIEIDENNWLDKVETVTAIQTSTRLVGIGADFSHLRSLLHDLDVAMLSSQNFIIILLCNRVSSNCASQIMDLVYDAKLIVLAPDIQNYEAAAEELGRLSSDFIKIDRFEEYLMMYDACYGFCIGTKTSSVTGNELARSMQNKQFTDDLGSVAFDSGANRLQNYAFLFLPDSSGQFSTALNVTSQPTPCNHLVCFTTQALASDESFLEQLRGMSIPECIMMGGCRSYLILIIAVVLAIIFVIASIAYYLIRRRRNMNAYRLTWKVSKDSLKVIESKQSKGKTTTENLSSKRRTIELYALLGSAKAEFICLKQDKRIRWTKEQQKFLFELKSLNHENLTNFLGICYNDGDRFYILHTLIERASLEDFIFDHEFNMDTTFRSAFIKDIIKGLQYLHKSQIGFHGMLSLQTCLIDANWVLKMTNFGISNMLHEFIQSEHLKMMEFVPQQHYITVAPELLKNLQIGRIYPKGTVAGDIYSFGMMLYSIMYRCGPFEKTNMALREIIEGVVQKGLKPVVENPEQDPLITMMCQCWSSSPEARPKLRNIHQTVNAAFASSKGNLVDQMIKMNEKYAQNLERIVAERNSMLVEAQEQTDRLLCEMLPPTIAAQLKAGTPIIPRNYESVTVAFCQIVDFGILMGKCTPDQVIAFLNDVFTTFDEIISKHDAYKVETTGETYMVASGVPNENEGQHVYEISEISLEIRQVASAPDWKLRVRIGFHCGPIAAGVIGLRSPRYCLFGDTVNFASRMQSNCQPNQIQMAEATAMILMKSSEYKLTKRGIVHVKGKGDVNTYWLNEHVTDGELHPQTSSFHDSTSNAENPI